MAGVYTRCGAVSTRGPPFSSQVVGVVEIWKGYLIRGWVDTARPVWKPQLQLLIGWGSWSRRTARVAPRDNVKVAPLTGRIRSHPRIRNPYVSLYLQQPGDESRDPRVDTAPYGVESPTPLADGRLTGAHGASVRRELPLRPTSRSRHTRGG